MVRERVRIGHVVPNRNICSDKWTHGGVNVVISAHTSAAELARQIMDQQECSYQEALEALLAVAQGK